jgi:hypothetical protein
MYISGGGLYKKPGAAAWRTKLKRDRQKRLERLAELVSEGYTVAAASRELGFTQQAGSKMWRDIRLGLGEQAQ